MTHFSRWSVPKTDTIYRSGRKKHTTEISSSKSTAPFWAMRSYYLWWAGFVALIPLGYSVNERQFGIFLLGPAMEMK